MKQTSIIHFGLLYKQVFFPTANTAVFTNPTETAAYPYWT